MNNKYEIDMCNGPLMSKLVSFSLPLMFSTILQLLFNAADLIVVGRFAKDGCLAAVGATTSVLNMFVNLFIGISLGANVCAARYFAQKRFDKMSKVVHTAILSALVSGVVILIIGQFLARPIMKIMDTPAEIIDNSVLYMRIYFLGTPFLLLYNFGAAILRAVGDTKRPMIFLIIAGVVNACLNVILVVKFHLDVAGVAIATIFSQCISCILVLRVLIKSPEGYRLHLSSLKIDFGILKKIVSIGIPAGVQSVVINLSNAMLQSSVNSFGADSMAGYTAANNMFGFSYAAANAVTQGCMSFTSQNLGVKKYGRMKKVLLYCLVLETVFCFAIGSCEYFFGEQLLGIYTTSEASIEAGLKILSLTTLTYFFCGYMDCIPGALRGMGYSTVPMILSIIGTVGVRIIWIYLVFPSHRDLKFLFICYPLSWIVTIILQSVCYLAIQRKFTEQPKIKGTKTA